MLIKQYFCNKNYAYFEKDSKPLPNFPILEIYFIIKFFFFGLVMKIKKNACEKGIFLKLFKI